jgi:hypothetical protein
MKAWSAVFLAPGTIRVISDESMTDAAQYIGEEKKQVSTGSCMEENA